MRFVIYSPSWRHNSGGIQVLHRLCHLLNSNGYSACITSESKPGWNCPLWDGTLSDDDYAIYPEIYTGNPLNAKHIIRYMLYYPWHHFGNNRIPKTELLIPYSMFIYPDSCKNCDYELPEDNILEVFISEPELFFINPSIKKDITSYWVSKSVRETVDKFNLPKGAVHIHHGYSREDVAKTLQRSRVFYSFDVNSAMIIEACLCGAQVFLVTDNSKVVPYWGMPTNEYAAHYNDTDRIHRFVNNVKNFKWGA